MNSSLLVPIWHAFKWLNRKRLQYHRLALIKQTNDPERKIRIRPFNIKKILLISVSDGWGNSLYLLGLAKRLYMSGYKVSLAVRQEYIDRFTGTNFLDKIIALGTNHLNENVKNFSPDIVVDLEYVALRHWNLRVEVLKAANCYSCCLSKLAKNSCYFDCLIPVETVCHISERLAMVLSTITKKRESPVYPFARLTEKDEIFINQWLLENTVISTHFIYLNCCARDADRCLSFDQTTAMINELISRGYYIVVNADCLSHSCQDQLTQISNKVRKLTPMTFQQVTALVKRAQFVITPDTSITHVATWANRPSLVIFPPNDRDYWSNWRAADVWNGRSEISTTIYKDDVTLTIDSFGFASVRAGRNIDYPAECLVQHLREFINRVKFRS